MHTLTYIIVHTHWFDIVSRTGQTRRTWLKIHHWVSLSWRRQKFFNLFDFCLFIKSLSEIGTRMLINAPSKKCRTITGRQSQTESQEIELLWFVTSGRKTPVKVLFRRFMLHWWFTMEGSSTFSCVTIQLFSYLCGTYA